MQQPSPTRLPGTPHERIEGHRPPYSAQIGRILQYVEGPSKKAKRCYRRSRIGGRRRCGQPWDLVATTIVRLAFSGFEIGSIRRSNAVTANS
jgi:hypothetical protein